MCISVWYLDHSGFAVESKNNFYIFDYYNDNPVHEEERSLNSGVVDPKHIRDKNVYVFSSHSHLDHYNSVILKWNDLIPNIKYIFSSDIYAKNDLTNIFFLDPYQTYEDGNIFVETLDSTDMGVAFYIEDINISIFHAGDLNWWHWKGETDEYNKDMEIKYKEELEKIKKYNIDIAFIPVDPRLEEFYYIAVEYFLNNIRVNNVFPMHFQKDFSIFSRLKKCFSNDNYQKINEIKYRGQKFTI